MCRWTMASGRSTTCNARSAITMRR
jgi:hypothetical protein